MEPLMVMDLATVMESAPVMVMMDSAVMMVIDLVKIEMAMIRADMH